MALYDREQIEARIQKCLDEIQDLIDLGKAEERELEPVEASRIDELTATAEGLEQELAKAKKLEEIQNRRAERQRVVNPMPTPGIKDPAPEAKTFKLPARASRSMNYWPADKSPSRHEALCDAYRSGRFLAATLFNHEGSRQWCQDHGVPMIRDAMSGGSGSAGGHLVPDEFENAVIDLREMYGVARQNCQVVSMGGDHRNVPKKVSELTAYAVNDNDTITASDKAWTNVELTAKKWGVLARYSSEVAEDAFIELADDLASTSAWALSKKEDQCVFIGTGGSSHHGVVGITVRAIDGSHTGAVYTATVGNTAFSTLDQADFDGMMGALPIYAENGAKWYFHKVGYAASIARLQNAAGGNTIMDLGNGPVRQFNGYPVVLSQVLNSTTTAQTSTVIGVFGNLMQGVTIGDRRGVTVAVDSSRYFDQDQIALRVTARTAINVHTLADPTDSTSAGPILVLYTPTS